jgi:hypothetical protein
MVNTGEYSEPLSHTAGSDGKFRVANNPELFYLMDTSAFIATNPEALLPH